MNDHIRCDACGSDWTIVHTPVRWRTQDSIDCPRCGRHLLKEQGHTVIRLVARRQAIGGNGVARTTHSGAVAESERPSSVARLHSSNDVSDPYDNDLDR